MRTPHKSLANWICLAALALPWSLQAQDMGDPACPKLLLISAFNSNNVKIHNACDGSFIRNLDTNNYLRGPQAIAIDPRGDLVVVSESNGRLVRYHRDSLTYDTVVAGDRPETQGIETTPVANPTGLAITPAGRMLVGSFSGDTVTEVDPADGSVIGHLASFGNSQIRGPDTGMSLDGNRLVVPGFNSSTLIEVDITRPGSDRVLVSSGSGGINAPRTVVKQASGDLLVTSWRGNSVLQYSATGVFKRVVSTNVRRPTGMALESNGVMLVASDSTNAIYRVRISDGVVLETLISASNGSLQGPTFILLLEKRPSKLAGNNPFWLIGVGKVLGKSIQVDEMIFTTGGQFGAAFDPDTVANIPWGSIIIEFLTCNSGFMTWSTDDPLFGSGGYEIFRLASDHFGDLCAEVGLELVDNDFWIAGTWYGGVTRNGEGFLINLINDGRVVVSWYTYLPTAPG